MKSTENPLVSIIIINYNGFDYVEKCFKSIMENNYKEFEIILVDNNSTDNSVAFVKETFPDIKIIKLDSNYGYAKPNNIGAREAKGDLLFFLNNDTAIHQDSITELVKVIENPEIGICQSLLLKPDGAIDSSGDYFTINGIAYSSRKKINTIKQILSARGASMMIKKKIFWELGGFDNEFFISFEDVDLGWRTWLLGYKVVVVPNSIVYHLGGQTVKKVNQNIKFHGVKNTLVLCLVNFEPKFSRKAIASLIAGAFKQKFSHSRSNDFKLLFLLPSFKTVISALFWIIRNYGYIYRKKKQINSKRRRSTSELINLGLITNELN